MKRRKFIKTSSVGALSLSMPVIPTFSSMSLAETRFGVADASYMLRRSGKIQSNTHPRFSNTLEMIDHCTSLGFGGLQTSVRGWDFDFSKKVRKQKEKLDIYLEAQISLPKTEDESARFDSEVKIAKETGIDIFRTACLSGRRYENFDSMESFQQFKSLSIDSLRRVEPIMRKYKVKLAVENHKDWLSAEMVEILKGLDSEYIGVTLDTGNNISLLEDPMEVVKALAPYAFSVHLKDMGVAGYEDGFLLSEVNLGEGCLDIEKMIEVIRSHNPDIRFNLEMITRDPLKIPCLTEKYWATFNQTSARELARYLQGIRNMKSKASLPTIANKSVDGQLAFEVENNRSCLTYAKKNLGFD